MKNLKKDQELMRILNLNRVNRLICGSDKGNLELCIRKGETTYFLVHDSVPVEKEKNAELMNLLFSPQEIPQVKTEEVLNAIRESKPLPKRMGRPPKVKEVV